MGLFGRNQQVIKKPNDTIYDEAYLRKYFKHHDKNGDGRLSKAEIKEAFKKLGAVIPNYRATYALNITDFDDNGYVDCGMEHDKLVRYAHDLRYKNNY